MTSSRLPTYALQFDLTGRVVVITGAARGLGQHFAYACSAAGAQVVVADKLLTEARATAAEIVENGGLAQAAEVDISCEKSVAELACWCADKFSNRIHGLVNNAALATGIGGKRYDQIEPDQWDLVMKINVKGPWLMVRAFENLLSESGSGRIVNIASDTALWGAPWIMHYVSSKGAVLAMTRALSRELGDSNITVNAIAPGLTLVPATEYVSAQRHQEYIDGRAIRRSQMPDDVAGTAVFLLSDAAKFVTGQTLAVNGGFVLN